MYTHYCISVHLELDIDAFERLMGPCMDVMKRDVDLYEEQLVAVFGSKEAATQLRTG